MCALACEYVYVCVNKYVHVYIIFNVFVNRYVYMS